MSTKGLIADPRVAHVELHPITGKAFKITLAPGWTFEGGSGPFELTSVDHGHKIVKAATNPDAPGRAARAKRPKAQPSGVPADPAAPYAPPEPSPKELRAIRKRDDIEAWVFRPIARWPGHEVTGWIRASQKPKGSMIKQARDILRHHILRLGGDPDTAEIECPRWGVEEEKAARAANTAGCPWPSLFRPGQTKEKDAPFNPEAGQ